MKNITIIEKFLSDGSRVYDVLYGKERFECLSRADAVEFSRGLKALISARTVALVPDVVEVDLF